jgi:ribosome maturation factor RimP
MLQDALVELLTPILAGHDLELEAIDVIPAGSRRLVRVVVDGDGPHGNGPLLDDIAEATRSVSAALDESDVTGNTPYTLEVSSRGVSRPLTLPRHWRRNVGRLVDVRTRDGRQLTGRIVSGDGETAVVDVDGTVEQLPLGEVTRALIRVELNRQPAEPEEED